MQAFRINPKLSGKSLVLVFKIFNSYSEDI